MRLGTQTASVQNWMMDGTQTGALHVGMGATVIGWTDRYACTVVEIRKDGREIVLRSDIAERTDKNGMSDSQSYRYQPNPDGIEYVFRRDKAGKWRQVYDGRMLPKGNGKGIAIGERDHHHDYSF